MVEFSSATAWQNQAACRIAGCLGVPHFNLRCPTLKLTLLLGFLLDFGDRHRRLCFGSFATVDGWQRLRGKPLFICSMTRRLLPWRQFDERAVAEWLRPAACFASFRGMGSSERERLHSVCGRVCEASEVARDSMGLPVASARGLSFSSTFSRRVRRQRKAVPSRCRGWILPHCSCFLACARV